MQPDTAPKSVHVIGSGAKMPWPLMVGIGSMLVVFILATTYNSPLSRAASALKWATLPLVIMTVSATLYRRPMPAIPRFMAIVVIGALAAGFASLWGASDRLDSMMSLVVVLIVILCGYLSSAAIVATDSRRAFFDLVAMICRVVVVLGTLFYLARINLGRGAGFAGWVDNPNTLASFLAPGLVVLIAGCIERRPGWKIWYLPFAVLGTALLWVTGARASLVWFVMSMGAFFFYRRGPGVNAMITVILALILLIWWEQISAFVTNFLQLNANPYLQTAPGPLSGREEVWRIGWDLFKQRPFLGYGMGSSTELLNLASYKFVRHQGLHFHSSYIMVLVETGLLGFVPFVLLLVHTLIRGFGDARRTQMLPRESWPTASLPIVILFGALGHATFESWIMAAGNVNTPLFWILAWMVHHQAQIPVRAVRIVEAPAAPSAAPPAGMLAAR